MKKTTALIALGLLIISICMVYLVYTGVSLRSAPLIRASVISADQSNIATAIVQRLFRELQEADYVLWGVLPANQDAQQVLRQSAEEYEKIFHQPVQILDNAESVSVAELQSCARPCWLLVSNTGAHQLEYNNFIEKSIRLRLRPFIALTVVFFNQNEVVTEECEIQRRLNLKCLISTSVREIRRKMKDPKLRYFFLRRYNENDFFLFIQRNT